MPSPIFFSAKANLLGFQCVLNASGLVAHPASPIPLARASGEIKRKGTAVVIVFNCPNSCDELICAVAELKTAQYKINNCTDCPYCQNQALIPWYCGKLDTFISPRLSGFPDECPLEEVG